MALVSKMQENIAAFDCRLEVFFQLQASPYAARSLLLQATDTLKFAAGQGLHVPSEHNHHRR